MTVRWLAPLFMFLVGAAGAAEPLDVVLQGGRIIDGTGAPARRGDVGVRAGHIVAIGALGDAPARKRISIPGLVVTPGFIDVHNHADEDVVAPEYRSAPGMISQGVTTAVFGVDGSLDLQMFRALKRTLKASGVGVNFAAYIGHNGLRERELGMADRPPTEDELGRMQDAVRAAMDEGALGLSTGLMYLPGRYATTAEVVALAKVTKPYGGLYDSHDRDPAFNLLDSVTECLDIGRDAGVAAHVAHLKAVGVHNAGRSADLVQMIDAARIRGEPVTSDIYPYDGATTRLVAEVLVAPPGSALAAALRHLDDPATTEAQRTATIAELAPLWRDAIGSAEGRSTVQRLSEHPSAGVFSWIATVGYDSLRIIRSSDARLAGRMIVDLAAERHQSPFDVLADLLLAQGTVIKLTVGAMREDDVRVLMKAPWMMFSSDGREGGVAGGQGHPRYRGSFARILSHYVREEHVLTLEEAVHKMTGLPADYLKLRDRGVLRVGAAADLAVFDPDAVRDRSGWDDPTAYATGMSYVFVNGVAALERGVATQANAGRFLPFRERAQPLVPATETP